MRSKPPKVLQPFGRSLPLLGHVVKLQKLHAQNIITIYGHGGELWLISFANEQIGGLNKRTIELGHADANDSPVLPQDEHFFDFRGVPCSYKARYKNS